MARVSLTVQTVVPAGLAPSLTAPTADGDVFDAGRVVLFVQNDSEDDITVTVPTPVTVRGLPVGDAGGTVPAGAFQLFGPFPKSTYGQLSGADLARVHADYSAVADVTRGLLAI